MRECEEMVKKSVRGAGVGDREKMREGTGEG